MFLFSKKDTSAVHSLTKDCCKNKGDSKNIQHQHGEKNHDGHCCGKGHNNNHKCEAHDQK